MLEKWWEKPVAFICNHLIIFTLLFFGIIASILFLAFHSSPAPQLQNQAPLTSEELAALKPRLLSLASIYDSPARRQYSGQFLDLEELSEQPENYEDKTQVIEGNLSRKETFNDLKDDWPSATIVWITQGANEILGLYRGNIDNIEPGENVIAEGLYVPEGDGLHIDVISSETALDDTTQQNNSSITLFYIAAGITLLWVIFVFSWPVIRKGKPSHPELFVLLFCCLGFLLSSCDIQIRNIIDATGQGTAITAICEDQENVDFFYQIPEMPDYIADRIVNFRRQGGFYEESSSGNKQCFTLQQNFSGSGDFSYNPNASEDSGENWAYIDHRTFSEFETFRYTAKINTSSLYEFNESIASTIRSEVSNSLDEIEMAYTVTLPGHITYSNADQIEESTGVWQIPMDETREIVIESTLEKSETAGLADNENQQMDWIEIFKWAVVAVIFIGTTVFFFKKQGGKNA